jgi:hypothetical protein
MAIQASPTSHAAIATPTVSTQRQMISLEASLCVIALLHGKSRSLGAALAHKGSEHASTVIFVTEPANCFVALQEIGA